MLALSARSKALRAVAVFGLVGVLIGACGGKDSSDETSTDEPTSEAAGSGSGDAAGGDTFKAAWVLVGPSNDGGWSQAHNEGRLAVEEALGDTVETTFKENVAEGPEATQTIEDLIKDGNKIIFATSFGYGDALKELATKYPDVYFEHATGAATSDNLATYFGAAEDTIYLTGLAAGSAVQPGEQVGFVAPFPIPEVIRHINALTIGVREVNPTATVKVVWTNTWFDPAKERAAADSLVAAGVKAIVSGQDSPASGEAAKAAGLPFVGYDSDQSQNLPEVWLTASLYHWGPYYTERVRAAMDGTWKTGEYYGAIEDGFVSLAPYGERVTTPVKDLIAKRQQEIVAGTFYEFTGPLMDQSGAEKVAAGTKLTLPEILTMDWFVQGVEGDPKG